MSQGNRRLAAIMYIDMVGYTALGQRNESLSLALVDEQRKLIRPVLGRHGGREVKTMGDAFLVEFPNALEAVRCSYDTQRAVKEFNFALPEDRRVRLRIGVHLGDVVESEGDISGDAVNVASRIEPLAEEGGVCITRQVYDQVGNKFELPLEGLGLKQLKNVAAPVEVFKIVLPWDEDMRPKDQETKRIAVLPFASMSPDPADEFFADGLTEEMITELSGLRGLGVIARTSVMRYKGAQKGVREIARDLGVGSVLEGSVRKAGNRIRITAQLIDAKDEQHLWASKYDRELDDIFMVQGEIAQSIAKALELQLLRPGGEGTRHIENVEAYTLCMKARAFWNRRTKSGIDQAILLFTEALKADPKCARAYAGLADCYDVGADWRYFDFLEAMAKAKEFATRALELDPNNAEAHAALGGVLHNERFEYERAEAEYRAAISLNPNYASAHQWYYMLLMDLGRDAEAGAEVRKAVELDPFSPPVLFHMALFSTYAGRLAEAEAWASKLIRTEPGYATAYAVRAWILALAGRKTDAIQDAEMFRILTDDQYAYRIFRAFLLAFGGDVGEGRGLIQEAVPLIGRVRNPNIGSPAWFYAVTGEGDEFFRWMEWSIDNRGVRAADLRYDPVFKKMKGDPRYSRLYKRFNLSPPQEQAEPGAQASK